MSELIESMATAVKARGAIPALPAGLTMEDAYEMQAALVRAVAGDAIAGYKAGLTAPAGQAQFGNTTTTRALTSGSPRARTSSPRSTVREPDWRGSKPNR